MTQACLPVWTEATDPGVLPCHDPHVLVQTTGDHAKHPVRDNQQGNVRLAVWIARCVWSTVWKSSPLFRHRPDASLQNDRPPNCAERPEPDRPDAEQRPWLCGFAVDQVCVLEPHQELRCRARVTHAKQDTNDVGRYTRTACEQLECGATGGAESAWGGPPRSTTLAGLMLGAIAVFIIDKDAFRNATVFALGAAVLSFFGLIHGAQGGIAVNLDIVAGYILMAAIAPDLWRSASQPWKWRRRPIPASVEVATT